jgi:hypothetical protein
MVIARAAVRNLELEEPRAGVDDVGEMAIDREQRRDLVGRILFPPEKRHLTARQKRMSDLMQEDEQRRVLRDPGSVCS